MSRRVVLFARVSTADKRRPQDPECQMVPLRAHAARAGWVVVEEMPLVMSAWDASTAAEVRRRALAPIVEGRADTLCVWALDRICREGAEKVLGFLRELENVWHAGFMSLQEPFLSTASDPQMRELLLMMLSWIAKWESQRKSERLCARVVEKRTHAARLGQRAIWARGRVASVEDLERARELRAGGWPIRKIAAELGISKSQVGRALAPVVAARALAECGPGIPGDGGRA